MPVTTRGTSWGGSPSNTSDLLVNYISSKIAVLEPQLRYAMLGKRKDIPKGYDRLLFYQPNQVPIKLPVSVQGLSGSVWGGGASIQGGGSSGSPVSSTAGVAAITEGTNPTALTWGATSYSAGTSQFGVIYQVSDLLVHGSAIEVIDECTQEVTNALARMVDDAIQNVVNGGSNGVIYAGGKTSRATLGAGDLLTQSDVNRGLSYLRSSNGAGVKPFAGDYYAAVIHPMVESDLMTNTGTGGFTDVGRYTSVDDLRKGSMGDFRGIRYLRSAWQNYYNSTVPVLPTTIVGQDSFGWGFFQEPTPIIVTSPDSGNVLNLFSSIGGKLTIGVTRFEDQPGAFRIVRCESAYSN